MKLVLLLPLLTLTLAATALAQEKQDQIEGDTNEIKVFSLKNMSAGDAANLLRDVLRRVPDETITVDQRRNSVLARSTPDRLKVMEALLLKLDSTPTEPDQLLAVYTLRHAKAGDALDVIQGVVRPSEEEGALRLGLDERSNAVVALASPDEHKLIRSILDQVDKSNEPAAAAAPTSIRFEIYWIADGEETTPIPAEIKRVLDEQKEKLGIPRPAILASASIAA